MKLEKAVKILLKELASMDHFDDPLYADRLGLTKVDVYKLLDKELVCQVKEDKAGTVTFRAAPRLSAYRDDKRERQKVWWAENWIALVAMLISLGAWITAIAALLVSLQKR